MNVGDQVTVVHGLPPELAERAVVRGLPRGDGRVCVQLGADGTGGLLWVDPILIDAGSLVVSQGAHTRARVSDPDTAHAAALAASDQVRRSEHLRVVLAAFVEAGPAGLIDHELEPRTGLIPTSAGVRRKDLERLGLVERTTRKRDTPSKRQAGVSVVTARGVAVHQLVQQPDRRSA